MQVLSYNNAKRWLRLNRVKQNKTRRIKSHQTIQPIQTEPQPPAPAHWLQNPHTIKRIKEKSTLGNRNSSKMQPDSFTDWVGEIKPCSQGPSLCRRRERGQKSQNGNQERRFEACPFSGVLNHKSSQLDFFHADTPVMVQHTGSPQCTTSCLATI